MHYITLLIQPIVICSSLPCRISSMADLLPQLHKIHLLSLRASLSPSSRDNRRDNQPNNSSHLSRRSNSSNLRLSHRLLPTSKACSRRSRVSLRKMASTLTLSVSIVNRDTSRKVTLVITPRCILTLTLTNTMDSLIPLTLLVMSKNLMDGT